MKHKDWLFSVVAGLLFGGLVFGVSSILQASGAYATDNLIGAIDENVDSLPTNYALVDVDADQDFVRYDELGEYSQEDSDWFTALAAYDRDWICEWIAVVHRGTSTASQNTHLVVGHTLAEIEAIFVGEIVRSFVGADMRLVETNTADRTDAVCRNSNGDEIVFYGSDGFTHIHSSN
jgi:hypothetical protein